MCVACVHRLCVCARPVGGLCGALSRCPRVLDCSASGVSEWTQQGPVWLSTQQCPWQHLGGGGGASCRASPPPPLLWMLTSHPTPNSCPSGSSHRLRQVAGPTVASSGNCCPRAMRREGPPVAEGGPPGGRGRDKGPGWASRCSAGPIPLEDELQCPLAHVRLAASSAGGPSSKGS